MLRIELQEFAYWGLATVLGVYEAYPNGNPADNTEWLLLTAADVQAHCPLFWDLHQATTARFMAPPSNATLDALQSLGAGETLQACSMSPTLDGGGGRGNVIAALAPANPCSGGGGSVSDSSARLSPPWVLAVVVAALYLVL